MYLGTIWAFLVLVGFLHHVGILFKGEILVELGVLYGLGLYLSAIQALLVLVGILHHVGTLVKVGIPVGVGVLVILAVLLAPGVLK